MTTPIIQKRASLTVRAKRLDLYAFRAILGVGDVRANKRRRTEHG